MSSQEIITIIAAVALAIVQIITALKTTGTVKQGHLAVHSRLTQLLEQTTKAPRAESHADAIKTVD